MKNLRIATPAFKSMRVLILFIFGLAALFAGIILIDKNATGIRAQSALKTITGEWNAEFKSDKPNEIYFMFQRRNEKGGFNMTSDNLPISELQGLAANALNSSKTNVSFSLVREAGTFVCEGFFSAGKGAGVWTLTPSQKFISEMRSRGYDNLSEEDLLSAAINNLTTKFADELKNAGYDRLTFEELRRARTHDVDAAYIREMKSADFENLEMEELIRARNHEIDNQYIQEVKAMGFENQPLETLIRMRNHDINSAFFNEMKAAGFENLSIEELIRLRNHDITVAFVNEIKAEGYTEVAAETAISLKNHDVDRDFIRRAKAQGYANASLEELIRLSTKGLIK
ncbi:MAG TPA: hypothetical protein VGC76_06365 [Pyrinomonadaceae bacterium]|jgi:uncharacterized protein (UPF0335 family)